MLNDPGMADEVVTDQADHFDIEPGQYRVRVAEVERITSKFTDNAGNPTYRMVWKFNVAPLSGGAVVKDADGGLYEKWGYTSTKLSPKSAGRAWFEALLGRPLKNGEKMSDLMTAVVGKKAIGTNFLYSKQDGQTATKIERLDAMPANGNPDPQGLQVPEEAEVIAPSDLPF